MAVPVRLDLLRGVNDCGSRLLAGLLRTLDERKLRLEALSRGLPEPVRLLEAASQRLDDRAERLANGLTQFLAVKRDRFRGLAERVGVAAVQSRVGQARDRLAAFPERLMGALLRAMEREQHRLESLAGRLESNRQALLNVLERGFVLVRDAGGKPVISAAAIPPGAALTLRFHDGLVAATAEGPRRRGSRGGKSEDQGSLF